MKIKLLLFLLLATLSFQSYSQNSFIKDFHFDQKVIISDGGASHVASLIKILAEGNGKSIRSTFFYISFGQTLKIITREPKFVYIIESESPRLSGDITYRNFDVSDYLIPTEVKFNLRQRSKSGMFWDRPMNATIDNGKIANCSYNDTDSNGVNYSYFDLLNFEFFFKNLNGLEKRVKQINNYYSDITLLDKSFALTQAVNPYAFENFRNNQRNLIEAETILAQVNQSHHDHDLPLNANDPGKFLEKRTILQNLIIGKRNEFNQVLSNLHLTFFDKALGLLRNKNYNRASEYLFWALEVNPNFTPALFQLAFIDFKSGNLHEALCKSDDILYNMPLDPETKSFTNNLLNDIYKVYLQRGQEAYKKKTYKKAVDEYEAARNICEKYNTVKCDDELQLSMSAAKKGIYDDYLNDARELVIINEFNRAENSTQTAIDFQQHNQNYIESSSEASELMNAIRQKRYDYHITRGIRQTDQKMFDSALETFEQADSLAELHHLKPNKDFRRLLDQAARPRTFELLYEGSGFVKSNQLPKAREKYIRASEMQQQYFLMDDAEVSKQLNSLRKSIFTQQCINTQNTVDSAYNYGQDVETEMQYLLANKSYEFALKTIAEFKECEIAMDSIESAIRNIRPAVTYLELMEEVKINQSNGRFQLAMENFEKASKYFLEAKVNRFGLDHDPDLFAYIINKGTNGMINYAGTRYREQGELDHSLQLYKLLLDRNYDVKMIEGSLYKLGFQLGARDKAVNQKSSWRDLVKEYTNNNRKLKRLRKGYKKGFRS